MDIFFFTVTRHSVNYEPYSIDSMVILNDLCLSYNVITFMLRELRLYFNLIWILSLCYQF